MGGDKYGNGGLIDVNDDLASGIDLGAKGAGLFFGGLGGASLASMGSKALFGEDKDGSSTLSKVNKGADMGLGAYNMAQGFQNASQMAKDAKIDEAVDASKGFSGVTSAGKGVDVGGTNAFGNALGEGNDINKAITGSGDMMNKLKKAIEAKDQIGSLIGNNEQNPNPQVLMEPDTSITPQAPISAMPQMNQILAAQLMNPASQNRLAFRRFA
jgi:hypothetical protein